jgi:hypothetical protein
VQAAAEAREAAERIGRKDALLRVVRRAVFRSDDNRFGHGRRLARLLKVALCKSRLWPLANYFHTKRRGYTISEGDGFALSYSMCDSLPRLARWADHLVVIPLGVAPSPRCTTPFLTAPTVLACATREG